MPYPADQLVEPFDDVRRIAVLRGGGLGDLLFALPAIDALAAAYPYARITLLGTPMAKALLEGRPGPVDAVELLPPARGVYGRDEQYAPAAVAEFADRMRAERFDLACQLHGGGRNSNPFVRALGARHTVGAMTPDAPPLDRTLAYTYYQHEVFRWLEVVALAGAPEVGHEPQIVVRQSERDAARAILDESAGVVVMHPGATDPRRRWPYERFAEVARRCAEDGYRVVVVGDGADAAIADAVAAEASVESLAGRLTLSELAGLLAVADLFVGNDSGPRHLAQGVGAPTVGLFLFGNVVNGGPVTRGRHRVHIGWTTHCPVCGRDVTQVGWTAERCEHDPSFLTGIGVDDVYADVRALLASEAAASELTARRAPALGR